MTDERVVLVYEDKAGVALAVADRFVTTISEVLEHKPFAHVVLTGGTVGIAVLAAINDAAGRDSAGLNSAGRDSLDWGRIHLWWGDERWLPSGDAERNDTQADDALISKLTIDQANVHRFPAADGPLGLDAAAPAYASELAEHAGDGSSLPPFDIVLLGVGADAHIASLFPGSEGIRTSDVSVVAVRNSPKPPPERLSLSLPALNSADRVWLALAGADKASALGLALAGANTIEVPVAGIEGRLRTVFFVDRDAAAKVPEELIVSDY